MNLLQLLEAKKKEVARPKLFGMFASTYGQIRLCSPDKKNSRDPGFGITINLLDGTIRDFATNKPLTKFAGYSSEELLDLAGRAWLEALANNFNREARYGKPVSNEAIIKGLLKIYKNENELYDGKAGGHDMVLRCIEVVRKLGISLPANELQVIEKSAKNSKHEERKMLLQARVDRARADLETHEAALKAHLASKEE